MMYDNGLEQSNLLSTPGFARSLKIEKDLYDEFDEFCLLLSSQRPGATCNVI